MEDKSSRRLLMFLIFSAAALHGASSLGVFSDKIFNVRNYGAVGDGKTDCKQAFLNAWNAACSTYGGVVGKATVRTRVVIPGGVFLAGPMSFNGPCRSPMVVQVSGEVRAPTNLGGFRDKEWIAFRRVDRVLITGTGKFDGQGRAIWPYKHGNSLPPTLKLIRVSNIKVRGITLQDAKFFHIIIGQSQRVAIVGVKITAPGDSPNTDGIHIGDSTDIRITRTTIGTGDDCISMGPGSTNVTINKVVCGPGHGISVGSLGKYRDDRGVDGIRVLNCTFVGTTNGVRIKTWRDSPPISATNLVFADIVMNDVKNPIIIDQEYCPSSSCNEDKPPSRVKISNVRYENIRGTSASDVAINLFCSSSVPCDLITLKDVDLQPLPPTPGLLPVVPLTACAHVGRAIAQGVVFPPPCF